MFHPRRRRPPPGRRGSEAETIMRVGLIINYYDVSRGGVERYADTLTRSLLAAGHRVRVMAAGAKELPEGAELVRVPELSFWSPARTWTFAKSVERLLDRERGRVDAVLGLARVPHQDVFRVGGGSHKAHLLATKPWTATRAGSALIRLSPRHAALLAMERRILEGWREGRTLRYLCNARHVRDEIIADYGVPLDRIDVLHNPVNTERFDPERWRSARGEARRSLGVPEGAYTLLFAGSGFHRKGLDAALLAMAGAPRGAWLIVAGAVPTAPWPGSWAWRGGWCSRGSGPTSSGCTLRRTRSSSRRATTPSPTPRSRRSRWGFLRSRRSATAPRR